MSTNKAKNPVKASTSSIDPIPNNTLTKKKIKANKPGKGTSLAQDELLEDELAASNGETPTTAARVKKPKGSKSSTVLQAEPDEPVRDKKLSTRTKPASTSKAKKEKTQRRSASGADASRTTLSTYPESSKQQSADSTGAGGKKGKAPKTTAFFDSDDDDGNPNPGRSGGNNPAEGGDNGEDDYDPDDYSEDESDFAVLYKYVPMAPLQHSARPTPAEYGEEILYTRLMTHCWAVATHDRASGGRTLVHFRGADTPAYYPELAGMISEETSVTVSNGFEHLDRGNFTNREFRTAKQNIKSAMQAAGKNIEGMGYARLFTMREQDEDAGNVPGTLKITPDGKCSRLTEEESESLLVIERRRQLREINARKRFEEKARRLEELKKGRRST